jgi:YVTN family beta-propeller protein
MRLSWRGILAGTFLALAVAAVRPALGAGEATPAGGEADNAARVTREGLTVEFSARPAKGGPDNLVAGDWADVVFRVTDAKTGKPFRGSYPAAWLDLAEAWKSKGDRPMSCRDRVATYLKGIVGVRPMIDLNSHFLLVMNRDASISVIDPAVGITGITNLFAQVTLERPGADWAKTADGKRMFVTMPLAGKVAVVDTETFKVAGKVDAGEQPTRARLQADGRYLWVGNDSRKEGESGVTVIDAVGLSRLAFIPTGKGHHEIAFSDDGRHAFVSNRDGGTVSVIDVQSLKKLRDLETGPAPIALAFSPLGKALYVADGKAGTVTVVGGAAPEIRTRIDAAPGLGPMRFSPDGRWAVAVNPEANAVYVVDASTNRLAHTVKVGQKPYQVTFTRAYAYVRSLGTEQVGLIPLSEFDKPGAPPVTYIPAGQGPPGAAADIGIADSVVPAVKHAGVYIVNQAEGTVHFYMEGMGAPMGSYKNRGHEVRAIETVDRSLSEREPGVYAGRVKIPVEGTYDVVFLMDQPRFVQCFSATVFPDPKAKEASGKLAIEYRIADRRVPSGTTAAVKFRLTDASSGEPRGDLRDVTVLYYGSDGRDRTEVPARALGDGFYEADVKVGRVITYYVYVGTRSGKAKYSDLPFVSLMGTPAPAPGGKPEAGGDGKP